MTTVEVMPETVQLINGKWQLVSPLAQSGGGLFAVTADWCSHCAQLKKTVPKAQEMNMFNFFWMDGDKHQAKAQEMDIQGFPSIYYIGRNGILHTYNGGRSAEQLAQVFHR